MQPPRKPLDRVLCLIEGYPSVFGGQEVESSRAANSLRMRRWMTAYPGTWFIVGDARAGTGDNAGGMRRRGYESAEYDGATYARIPHRDGLPIEAVVARRKPWHHLGDKLPELKADRFGWSGDEMTDALATAKAWLFPIEGIQAA